MRTLFILCFEMIGHSTLAQKVPHGYFSPDIISMLDSTSELNDLRELIIVDKKQRLIFNGYGFIVEINRSNDSIIEIIKKIPSPLGGVDFVAIKYHLIFNANCFIIRADTSSKLWNAVSDKNQQETIIKFRKAETQLSEEQIAQIEYILVRAALQRDTTAIALFRSLDKLNTMSPVASHEHELYRSILVDYGIIENAMYGGHTPKVYEEKFEW